MSDNPNTLVIDDPHPNVEQQSPARTHPDDTLSSDARLPCDVWLAPQTRIAKGCKISTLMAAIRRRESGDCPAHLTAHALRIVRQDEAEPEPQWSWWYAAGRDPDNYTRGGPDRLSTIAEAAESDLDKVGFTIVEATQARVSFDFVDADGLIEQFEDHNEECWGEDGSDINPTREQKAELEKAVSAVYREWAERHGLTGRVWCFGETRNQMYFAPVPVDQEEGDVSL